MKNIIRCFITLAIVFFISYLIAGRENAITFTILYGVLSIIVLINDRFHDFWYAELAISLILLPYTNDLIKYNFSVKISDLIKLFAPSIAADKIPIIVNIGIGVIIFILLFSFHLLIKMFPWMYKKHIFNIKIGRKNIYTFCKYLKKYMEKLNNETNWNMENFIEMEAHIGNKQVNLLKALEKIKYYNDKLFLVLGDPGSGKSVALRKLCLDMLYKVNWNNKIPLYINLKEWVIDWGKELTKSDLNEFIKSYLKKIALDDNEKKSIEKYYNKILKAGYFCFIFDSYDELTALGGKNEIARNNIIEESIYDFILYNKSGCILASRYFRQPTVDFKNKTIFHIDAFDDVQIFNYFKKISQENIKKDTIKNLYLRKDNILAYLHNPFTLSLVYEYYKNHNKDWPNNQSAVYKSFLIHAIKNQLNKKPNEIEQKTPKLFYTAAKIAKLMILSDYSKYSLTINEIKEKINVRWDIEKSIEILVEARICRYSDNEHEKIMFSHNRFQEYFYIRSMNIQLDEKNLEDIPNCGKYYDILALYCEIAPLEKAEKIVNYCNQIISENGTNYKDITLPKCRRAINCLSFMATAFPKDHKIINNITITLSEQIIKSISDCNDTFCLCVFAEISKLLDTDGKIEKKLLIKNRQVVNDILIRSTYYKKFTDKGLRLFYYIGLEKYPTVTFFKKLQYLMFILSLNTKTTFLKYYFILRIINTVVILGMLVFACINSVIGRRNIFEMLPYINIRNILAIIGWPLALFIHDRVSSKSMPIERILLCLFVIPLFGFTGQIILFSIALFFISFSLQELLIIKEKMTSFFEKKNKEKGDFKNYFSWLERILFIALVVFINLNIFFAYLLLLLLAGLAVVYPFISIFKVLISKKRVNKQKQNILNKLIISDKKEKLYLRKNVEDDLAFIKKTWQKKEYINLLYEKKIKLTGEWKNGRPYISDDYADKLLTDMDVQDLTNLYRRH